MNIWDTKPGLFDIESQKIKIQYPNLHFKIIDDKLFLIGRVCLNDDYGTGDRINDCYSIAIAIPDDYPDTIPTVKETEGKIPSNYHKYTNRDLCLGVKAELYLKYKQNASLSYFIKHFVEPYLYTYSFFKKHDKKPPWGDRAHHGEGILDFYREFFLIKEDNQVLNILETLEDRIYSQSMECPCGSGKMIKKCHKKEFLEIYNMVPVSTISYELKQIRDSLNPIKKMLAATKNHA